MRLSLGLQEVDLTLGDVPISQSILRALASGVLQRFVACDDSRLSLVMGCTACSSGASHDPALLSALLHAIRGDWDPLVQRTTSLSFTLQSLRDELERTRQERDATVRSLESKVLFLQVGRSCVPLAVFTVTQIAKLKQRLRYSEQGKQVRVCASMRMLA
jgi:hypothetical protein